MSRYFIGSNPARRVPISNPWPIRSFARSAPQAAATAVSYVLDVLEKRFENPGEDIWEVSDFHCQTLSRDTYLVTYTLLQQKQRLTRRSSIWRRSGQAWRILYHQGTVVEAD